MIQSLFFFFFAASVFLATPGVSADMLSNLQLKATCAIHTRQCKDGAQKTPQILQMALLSCQAVAQSSYCQELVKKEPEFYGKTKRCGAEDFCADHMTQELDSLKSCGLGFLEGTGETMSQAIDLLKGAWGNIEKQNKLITACNQSLECKRDMVKDIPKFQKITDEQLRKYSAAALKVERDNFIYNQSTIARQSIRSKTLSERAEEAERRKSEVSVSSEGTEKIMLGGVKDWLKKKGARLECLDTKTQAEMICWGAAAILDPLVVAGAASKGVKLAKYVNALGGDAGAMAIMGSSSRKALESKMSPKDAQALMKARAKDAEYLQRIRTPAVDGISLKRHMNEVWSDQNISVEGKISDTFEEYIRLRTGELSSEKKLKAQEALSNIQLIKEKNAGYYPATNEIKIGDAFADDALTYYQTVVHEFEHLTQNPMAYVEKKPVMDRMQDRLTKLMKKRTDDASLGENKNIRMEMEAIGAQWDFLQAIPAEARQQSMQKIRASKSLSEENKVALLKDLEMASLSREDYLKTVPQYHGYSHVNEVQWQSEMNSTWRMAVIYGSAVAALGGAAEFYYGK